MHFLAEGSAPLGAFNFFFDIILHNVFVVYGAGFASSCWISLSMSDEAFITDPSLPTRNLPLKFQLGGEAPVDS